MLEWNKLRPYHGTQQTAFEELCCQLARNESMPTGAHFYRKGTPDAGVECYWTLPGGDEVGWQAKFFLTVPGVSQWAQLRESFSTAMAKHPRLVRYCVCLPQDRADPRVDGRNSITDRWVEFVQWCQKQAQEAGRSVEVDYWGDSEIFGRLALAENRGRQLFWFDAERFTLDWFLQRLDEAVANAGERYSPELNIDLAIGRMLDGLGRTERFWRRFTSRIVNVRNRWADHFIDSKLPGFVDAYSEFLSAVNRIETAPDSELDFSSLSEKIRKFRLLVNTGWTEVKRLDDQESQGGDGKTPHFRSSDDLRRGLRQVDEAIGALEVFVSGSQARAADNRAMLVTGRAGAGKTHLFCDAARHRLEDGQPSILMLGELIQRGEPWMQVIRNLGLTMGRDDFLGVLNAAAETAGTRLIIFMDALNEGDGSQVWPNQLAGFLEATRPFRSLVVALSIRDLYEERVIPPQLDAKVLMRVAHEGFEEKTEEATRRFFQHFKIALPDYPILNPEFGTPLFLKLFCTALRNEGISEVPKGFGGITAIFSFFLQSINRKLAARLDYDPAEDLLGQAIAVLAATMAQDGVDTVDVVRARALFEQILPNTGFEQSLLRQLCSEGILQRTMQYDWRAETTEEVVKFSYQRLSDHLIVGQILTNSTGSDGEPDLATDKPLAKLLEAENLWQLMSWIEALAIQLPERFGIELADLAPELDIHLEEETFEMSLLWRRSDAYRARTLALVDEKLAEPQTRAAVLRALLLVNAQPDHPLNANFLHQKLMLMAMAERDKWWSMFLYWDYSDTGIAPGVIEWAWAERDRTRISDAAIELCGTTLTWFFTSSQRFLRDRATKALVSLLEGQERVLIRLLEKFREVNDPYVSARLYAVAHGVVLRSEDNAGVKMVAEWIHGEVFAEGTPPPSVMLRMHAAAAVQAVVARGLVPTIDPTTIRPPFKSAWPETIPSLEELRVLFDIDKWDEEKWGLRRIYNSVTDDDFSHYVIRNSINWSCYRLDRPAPVRTKVRFARLVRRVPRLGEIAKNYEQLQTLERLIDSESGRKSLTEAGMAIPSDFPAQREKIEAEVAGLLSTPHLKKHVAWVVKHLRDPSKAVNEQNFGIDLVRRAILQRVIELGYRADWFSKFDEQVPMGGRSANKAERIGKKYQWIAYHEVIARISDNFRFADDAGRYEPKGWFEGGWMKDFRDIDPSLLLKSDRVDDNEGDVIPVAHDWWVGPTYDAWAAQKNDLAWLRNADDLPAVPELVRVTNPEDGSSWLCLDSFVMDRQVERLGAIEHHKPERREVFRFINGYLVRRRDATRFANWARDADFSGRWMPEPNDYHQFPLHEFYWAPQFTGEKAWTKGAGSKGDIPVPVATTGENYNCEAGTLDCSLSESVQISLPAKILVEKMALRIIGRKGQYHDNSGELVAYDPAVGTDAQSCLLIRESAMKSFLKEQKLELFWVVIGEKNVYPNDLSINRDKWLGRLEYYGAYRYGTGEITGESNSRFIPR